MRLIITKPFIILFTLFLFVLSACTQTISPSPAPVESPTSSATLVLPDANPSATPTAFQPEKRQVQLYLEGTLPSTWLTIIDPEWITMDPQDSDLSITLEGDAFQNEPLATFERTYAVVAPFPTVEDAISLDYLKSIWKGEVDVEQPFTYIMVSPQTLQLFNHLWGDRDQKRVTLVPDDDLRSELWKAYKTVAIVPFELIEPRYKVLRVDDISPLDRPMDVSAYGLTIRYNFNGNENAIAEWPEEIAEMIEKIPATNRDESKMAVVIMTGTTALARMTLFKIDEKGIDYPIEEIKPWFDGADLRHVSNEVSFTPTCEFTNSHTMRFCSKEEHIKVLEDLGINVVESTGNHLNDYGADYFASTLQMYKDRGWLSYGGGANIEESIQPVMTEVNGNRIAFIGCNTYGPENGWATETRAGAAPCDFPFIDAKIAELKAQGYIVIVTYQHNEIPLPMYDRTYRQIFLDAANAGADIVQGSQAHVPMGFGFVEDTFIHYGLGNFLFDQIGFENNREFIDRHILYDGKYISTEILTAKLTDWSRPVPMSAANRAILLDEMFTASKLR